MQIQKRSKRERRRPRPQPPYAYSPAYGQNHQIYNEPLEKTPRTMVGTAEEAVVEVAVEEVVVAVGMETHPRQGDPPQVTPEEESTDFSDNPRTYSPETAQRRRSSSRSGSSITT